jgi:histone-lysine N-methyltransferase SETD3
MRMAVSSRIFGIKVNGKKTDCFCPLADMLNHRRPRQTQWFYSDEQESFVIQAIEDINAGDEIYDSYGKKCNSRFFLNYGFIVEKNENNEFPFNIELTTNVVNYEFKFQLIDTKTNVKTFRLPMNLDECIVKDFFSFLRFIYYEDGADTLLEVKI